MTRLFAYATEFMGDISKWNVSKVEQMSGMFLDARSFDGDISKWDVSRVASMSHMFHGASSFNSDISKWDVSRVAKMDYMFWHASSFEHTFSRAPWVHSKASKVSMFEGSSGSIAQKVRKPAFFKSKVALESAVVYAWDCPQKGIAQVVRMDQLASGISHR